MEDSRPAAAETILVVAPVFNESGCIEEVVESWLAALGSHPGSEMLLIDDGSTDGTWDKLQALAARHGALQAVRKANEGHGPTVRRAYEEAVRTGHDWVFQTDSDAQFDPADLGLLWRRRSDSDFILGARRRRHDPFHRLVITRLVRLFNFCLFQTWIEDANVPFRLIRRAYLAKLLDVVPRNLFAPNIFLSVLAARDGQDLLSIPVRHLERSTGKVSIVRWRLIASCLRGVRELMAYRLTLRASLRELRLRAESAGPISGG